MSFFAISHFRVSFEFSSCSLRPLCLTLNPIQISFPRAASAPAHSFRRIDDSLPTRVVLTGNRPVHSVCTARAKVMHNVHNLHTVEPTKTTYPTKV
jgi:hypothetical protein